MLTRLSIFVYKQSIQFSGFIGASLFTWDSRQAKVVITRKSTQKFLVQFCLTCLYIVFMIMRLLIYMPQDPSDFPVASHIKYLHISCIFMFSVFAIANINIIIIAIQFPNIFNVYVSLIHFKSEFKHSDNIKYLHVTRKRIL